MRAFVLVSLLSLCGALTAHQATAAEDSLAGEKAAVVKVVSAAYVDGIHNFRDPVAIRAGFHPDFVMLVLKDGKLEKVPLETWIERLVASNAKEPPPSRESGMRSTEARFPVVEVTGSAAVCEVEISRDGKQIFTDYLSLYKFPDGWKIVGKIFYRHP